MVEALPNGRTHRRARAARVTRIGWFWLGITTLLAAIGLGKNINLLILLAYTLVVIFGLNVLSAWRQTRRLWARRLLPDLVFAKAPCSVATTLGNDGADKAALHVEDSTPLQAGSGTWAVNWLPSRQQTILRGAFTPTQRGPCELPALRVSSTHPFGLFERRRVLGDATKLLVLPALGWLNRGRFLSCLRCADFQEEEMRRRPRRSPVAQAEFHGLRPFRAGDSPRLIHWRTSARRGELMTREYEDAPGQNLVVVFDAVRQANDDPLSSDGFEMAVSLAATICHEWCRRRGDRLIVAIAASNPVALDDFSGPDHERRILEALAVVNPVASCDRAALLASLTRSRRFAASLVIVSAGVSSLGEWLASQLQRPALQLNVLELDGCDFYEPPH